MATVRVYVQEVEETDVHVVPSTSKVHCSMATSSGRKLGKKRGRSCAKSLLALKDRRKLRSAVSRRIRRRQLATMSPHKAKKVRARIDKLYNAEIKECRREFKSLRAQRLDLLKEGAQYIDLVENLTRTAREMREQAEKRQTVSLAFLLAHLIPQDPKSAEAAASSFWEMTNVYRKDSISSDSDIEVEKVVIKNLQSMIPNHFCKLTCLYREIPIDCVKCDAVIDIGELDITAGVDVHFHFICLIVEYKFQGKVSDIKGFDKISAEDRDMLKTNCSSCNDSFEDDQMSDEELEIGFDMEMEPISNTMLSIQPYIPYAGDQLPLVRAKEKSPQRSQFDEFVKSIISEKPVKSRNPESNWGQKGDLTNKQSVIKRGTLVDKEFQYSDSVHVLKTEDRYDLFSITLCQADILSNRNAYFKMQLLKDDTREIFYLFRSWGRIGTKRGNTFEETFHVKNEAIAEFEADYQTLTGCRWRERHFYQSREGFMTLVEMDYTEFETLICDDSGRLIPAGTRSTLHPNIKAILLKIFDASNIKKALDGYNFDLERMPMGKLSAMQVSRASGLLNQVSELMKHRSDSTTETKITELSNKFYSNLPQSFGHCAPTILTKAGQMEKMRGMIDALLDIQFVCNIMQEVHRESTSSGLDPIDLQYNKLMTNMEVVPQTHEDYNLIVRYINNGIGSTHGYKGFQLLDLIRLDRYGEYAKFRKQLGNRKLLWHGSPIQNFPGILTQGLRIAPPDALQTGHAFGRGVYFADMISKSANYCRVVSRYFEGEQFGIEDNIGYLLLCEVALGNMKECTYGSSAGIPSNETQYQSIKGAGETYPNPEEDYLHPDGYIIPMGRAVRAGNSTRNSGFLYYNEFIVYDTDQICARYLCRVKFDPYR